MGRRVKDFIEISEYTSLDQLINTLTAIRDNLPEEAEPELRMKGDDVFGRRLSISYFRELTAEEATLDARYNGSDLPRGRPGDREAARQARQGRVRARGPGRQAPHSPRRLSLPFRKAAVRLAPDRVAPAVRLLVRLPHDVLVDVHP